MQPPPGAKLIGGHPLGDPAAIWTMAEDCGLKINDSSSNKNTGVFGTIGRTPFWKPGKFGPSIYFSLDEIFAGTRGLKPTLPYTILAWFNHTSGTNGAVVSLADSTDTKYITLMAKGNVVSAFVYDGANKWADSVGTYAYGEWVQGVVVFETLSKRRAYINGGGEGIDLNAYPIPAIDRCGIGVTADSTPGLYLIGGVDHVMIWNRALSASEIQQLFYDQFPMFARRGWPVGFDIGGAPAGKTILDYERSARGVNRGVCRGAA